MNNLKECIKNLPTPAVVVDLDIAEKNIIDMVERAKEYGINHRPHIKTHRCSMLAKMQITAGCKGITVAKLGEAEVMCDAGLDDIFVAYSLIGDDKIARLVMLAKKCKVSTVVNSVVGAKALSDEFVKHNMVLPVLIEVDGGLNRGGVKPMQSTLAFANEIKKFKGLHICGIMYYGGLAYNAQNIDEVKKYSKTENDDVINTADLLKQNGFCMDVLSAGSSLTGKTPEIMKDINEIRSGHYIFNDCNQLDVGLATPDDCALTVVSTVVCKPDEFTVIADVGTKTLTSDKCHYREGFGYIVNYPEVQIYSLNEEHAFLKTNNKENPLKIGDKIEIIPNHACVITNLANTVYGVKNSNVACTLHIDARGKSV